MNIAIDTNILIAAHLATHPDHVVCRQKIEAHLSLEENRIVLTPFILHEFLHVITDPRRFESPPTLIEAIAIAKNYLHKSNVTFLTSDPIDLEEAMDLLLRHHLGRMRIADMLFAATLKRHGVKRLWTRNRSDFQVFDFLEVEDPS